MFAILLYPLLLLSLIPNRERSFVALNGFAELTPGMLTIPMIKGQGADSAYFDLDKGEIGGKIVYKSKSGKDENISTMLSGFTSIDGGLILTDTIKLQQEGKETGGVSGSNKVAFWAGGLGEYPKIKNPNNPEQEIDDKSKPLGNVLIRHDGTAKVGCFNVDDGGAVSVWDTDDKPRLQFIAGNIPTKVDILSGYDSGHVVVREFGGSGDGIYTSSETASLKEKNENLKVKGNVIITASASEQDKTWVVVSAELYAVGSTGTKVFLGSSTARAGEQFSKWNDKQSISISYDSSDKDIEEDPDKVIINRGTYHLQLEVTRQSQGSQTLSNVTASGIIDHFYLDDNKRQTLLGLDGLSITSGVDAYLYCSPAGNGGTFLEIKGKTDMPGVLAAGRVAKGGYIENQWGYKECGVKRIEGTIGQYEITHSINHLDYFINVTPVTTGWQQVHAMIKEKTEKRTVIYLCDSVKGTTNDCGFEFMLCGKN